MVGAGTARAGALVLAAMSAGAACVATGCGGDEASCDRAEIESALASARAGDTVRIGACRVDGPFVVGEGVTLAGEGTATVVVAPAGGTAITVIAAAAAAGGAGVVSRVADLSVESDGQVGVRASGSGAGAIAIERVHVRATRGVGVWVESVAAASVDDVALSGPVTAETATTVPPDPDDADIATHGLLLIDVAAHDAPASLGEVRASGFARFGVLAIRSHVAWRGGGATDNLGTGLSVEAGSMRLEGVELCRTLAGLQPRPAYGGVFSAGAELSSVGLDVCDGEGIGLLVDQAVATLDDVHVHGNGDAGIWAQRATAFELRGATSEVTDNALAGIVLRDVGAAIVSDAHIDATRSAPWIWGDLGRIDVGDGIHAVVERLANIVVRDVVLTDNARAGVLIDSRDSTVTVPVFERVSVSATGPGLGAIAQDAAGALAPGGEWDRGVTRLGSAAVNDAAFTGRLDIVGLIGPMNLPPSSF